MPIDYLLSKGNDTEKLTTLDREVHTVCVLINLCPSVVTLKWRAVVTCFGKTKDTNGSNCVQKMENVLCRKFFPLRPIGFLTPLQVYLVLLIKCNGNGFFQYNRHNVLFCKRAIENYFSTVHFSFWTKSHVYLLLYIG